MTREFCGEILKPLSPFIERQACRSSSYSTKAIPLPGISFIFLPLDPPYLNPGYCENRSLSISSVSCTGKFSTFRILLVSVSLTTFFCNQAGNTSFRLDSLLSFSFIQFSAISFLSLNT